MVMAMATKRETIPVDFLQDHRYQHRFDKSSDPKSPRKEAAESKEQQFQGQP